MFGSGKAVKIPKVKKERNLLKILKLIGRHCLKTVLLNRQIWSKGKRPVGQ
jgi:hypothetical protein